METAGLNFTVKKEPCYQLIGDDIHPIPNKFVISRVDNNTPLGIVGPAYVPYQNNELASFLKTFQDLTGGSVERAGFMNNGACVWAMVKSETHEVIHGDPSEDLFLVRNTFDGSSSLDIGFINRRVVCNNMIHAAYRGSDSHFNIQHTRNMRLIVRGIETVMIKQKTHAENTRGLLGEFAQKRITHQGILALTERLIAPKKTVPLSGSKDVILFNPAQPEEKGPKAISKIMELVETGLGTDIPGVRGSVYGWLQAVTEYVDHHRPIRSKDKDEEEARFNVIMFGAGARLKTEAFRLAMAA
jgi:phage/plasmid-like protein (TIGR03299 family)